MNLAIYKQGWPATKQEKITKRHSEKRKVTAKNERFHEQRKVTRENRKGIYSIKWPAIKFCTINECGGRPQRENRETSRNERFLRKTRDFTRNGKSHEKTEKSYFSLSGRPTTLTH